MYCHKCGQQIKDNAAYCAYCGAEVKKAVKPQQNAALIPAKCTNCAGILKVNRATKEAVCPFCNQTFIVEQAVNNYNINLNINSANISVSGAPSVSNLLARAYEFETSGNTKKAVEYYNRVLDIDYRNEYAKNALKRIEENNFNFLHGPLLVFDASSGLSAGQLCLTRTEITYTTKRKVESHPLNTIKYAESSATKCILHFLNNAVASYSISPHGIKNSKIIANKINEMIKAYRK